MTTDVFSFGGGVQSWGYAALVVLGELPAPDFAVMVDTCRECGSTWAYYEKHKDALPFRLIVSRQPVPDIFYRNGDCLLPAYFNDGKLPTFCSGEWKRDVFRRHLRALGVDTASVAFGISYDESERMTSSGKKWLRNSYPLVDRHIRRGDCLDAAASVFGEAPPRSRCWMCPNQSRADWLSLPESEIAQAAQVDADIRSLGLYLSKHRLPLRDALVLDAAQLDLFGGDCDGGYCYV